MTIFDHLRECAANGDTPTLDAEDAARIVKTIDLALLALDGAAEYTALLDDFTQAAIHKAVAFARNPTL